MKMMVIKITIINISVILPKLGAISILRIVIVITKIIMNKSIKNERKQHYPSQAQ